MPGAQRRTEYTQLRIVQGCKRFRVEMSMQGLEIRAEKQMLQSRTSVHRLHRRTEYAIVPKWEQSMQGLQIRVAYASIIEKNRVLYLGCRVEHSMQF